MIKVESSTSSFVFLAGTHTHLRSTNFDKITGLGRIHKFTEGNSLWILHR